MRYILQLNTGSLDKSECKAEEAIRALEYCIEALDVEKVIFGWTADAILNQTISGMLDEYPVEKYLWLPVFAEIQNKKAVRQNVNLVEEKRKEFNACIGDAFDFVCQSSQESLEGALEVFDKLAEGCRMDGVFLDRIRYASGASSVGAMYGCWCPYCREAYRENGVNIHRIQTLAEKGGVEQFMPEALENCIYRYKDEDIDRLMATKRKIISRQVRKLCNKFRDYGLKIGADTFAPAIADFVGQDIFALAEEVDFVKPMTYVRTDAPAGIPFELQALGGAIKEKLDQLWGGDTESMAQAIRQIQKLKNAKGGIAPGIDANKIEGICDADTAYVKEFLQKLMAAGIDRVVLSWDIMRISRETIDAIADIVPVV